MTYFLERVHPRLSSHLDCLRWVAAGVVVASHVRSMMFWDWASVEPSQRGAATALFYLLTSFGHQAVIVFFVLSGFLVGGSVVGDIRRGRFAFPVYLVNRVSRLYVVLIPALVLGWLCDLVGSTWCNSQGVYTAGWPQTLWSLQFDVVERMTPGIAALNALNLQTIVVPTFGSNGPLWSLANEFWYYIIFPLVLAPFMHWRPRADRLLLLLAGIAVGALIYPEILLYGLVWALGVAIRFVPRALIPWEWLSTVLLLVAVVVCARLPHWHAAGHLLGDGLLAVMVANLLLTLMHHPRPAHVLAGGRLHARLADFSYSLYLLHFPLLVLLGATLQERWACGLSQPPSGWLPFASAAGVMVALYLYAWLISLLTERHTAALRELLGHWSGVRKPARASQAAASPAALPGALPAAAPPAPVKAPTGG